MLDFTKMIILDGAMGTMLQKAGVTKNQLPEEVNITNPEIVIDIHRQYIEAGCQIISTNTFGANAYKVGSSPYTVEQLITAAVQNAKKAAAGTDTKIALDIGPIGKMLRPNGDLAFEEAYQIYKQMIECGVKNDVDLIFFETIADLLEMKAGILAAKENANLPIFCSMTFEANQRTFAGVSVPAMAAVLEGLGADVIGFNCSLGPTEMLPLVQQLATCTNLPILVKANAGLPNLKTNEYDIDAQQFCDEYIQKLSTRYGSLCPIKRKPIHQSVLTGATDALQVNRVCIVGERINPTGKKLFKQALQNRNIGYILSQGIEQIRAGADILDVNVGLPGTDEKDLMVTVIEQLQSITDVPLQIDSSSVEVLEAALRIYNGKPIVNSVNGEQEVLDSILPLVKKYGAAVIGLTLDQNGIPSDAQSRYQIAERIVKKTEEYGIPREDIYIDCLTLTASVQQAEVVETLKAMQLVKQKLGVKTVLGVSNISFGLPARELINKTFLTLALAHGLDLPIINPNITAMTEAIDAFNVLYNHDIGATKYIQKYNQAAVAVTKEPAQKTEMTLDLAVRTGLKEEAAAQTEKLMQTMAPMDIVDQILIPSLDKVGQDFETNVIFLPQLIQSATAAQAGFDVIKKYLAKNNDQQTVSKGKIVLATVKGDIHDIGKNIVKVILENYGYDVIDLGKDVPIDTVVRQTIDNHVHLVGLSALMTTTVVNMEATIRALRDAGADCKIMVGGAVLTQDFAKTMGADYYAKDAKQSADIAKEVLG